MTLEFIGETGVYFADRDAIKFTALSAGEPIDCFVGRPAMEAIGCRPTDGARDWSMPFRGTAI